MTLVPCDQAAEILQPGEEALDLPASLVATKATAILASAPSSAVSLDVRRDETNTSFEQYRVEWIAVVRLVADERMRQFFYESFFDDFFDELRFVGRSASNADGDRKTRAVCNCHDLGPFAALRFPDAGPPFFAPAKVASMNVSERSSFPRMCRCSARARRIALSVPRRCQSWNRRWQVWCGGYRGGRSCQGAPVRRIHRMPLSTARASRGGLPRLPGRARIVGSKGSMIDHCSSVRSISDYKHISVAAKRWFPKLKQFRSAAIDDFRDDF
jgi:hypothetical protein